MQLHTQRRLIFGLNVTIAVLVALAIVVLLNYMGNRHFVRIDRTATRQYSLSPQTLKVIAGLKSDYRIVTLFDRGQTTSDEVQVRQRAIDLIDEYARYSKRITVEHLDPSLDVGRVESLYKTLNDRYKDKLTPQSEAIESSLKAVEQARQAAVKEAKPIQSVLDDPGLASDSQTLDFVRRVALTLGRFDTQLDSFIKTVRRSLDSPLPDYAGARDDLERQLDAIHSRVLTQVIEQFRLIGKSPQSPASVRDTLLTTADNLQETDKQVQQALTRLQSTPGVDAYDQLRSRMLQDPNTVIVFGPGQERVLTLNELVRNPTKEQQRSGNESEQVFLGEERITGSLVSMSLENPPMVVFVSTSPQPVLTPGGNPQLSYTNMADRLRAMNFDVREWSPMPRQIAGSGQTMPPEPAPQPKEGQPAVWVVLPSEPINPMNPMAAVGPESVATMIKQRLALGDSMLFILVAEPMASFGGGNPIVPLLSEFGASPQLDRVIFKQTTSPDGQKQAVPQHSVTDWSSKSLITQALGSLNAMFPTPSPIVTATADDKVKVTPIVVIKGQGLWAHAELMSNEQPQYNPATAADSFTVGVACEKSTTDQDHPAQRVIVVADPLWACDLITGYGAFGPGSAEITGAAFPGNSELFVNSIYWLSHQDSLIAAGARTQDIRRIGDMSVAALTTIRTLLLAGLPLLVMGIGLAVWVMRRRG
ncbi:MAG: hypothetical protein GC164_07605 [Phycisphaera sp.]|nr:hypothetical protein [Phycisphaera sp.]